MPTPAHLNIQPAGPYNFGLVPIGSSADIPITLKNTGQTDSNLNSVVLGIGAPYSIIANPAPGVITAGTSLSPFTLRFSPVAAGTFNDSITFTCDVFTDGSPRTINITGSSAAPGVGSLSVTPALVNFPDTTSGRTATPIAVVVKNTGTINVVINAIALGVGLPFALTGLPGLPLTLTPGSTTTFNAGFSPLLVGSFSDSINITTAGIGVVSAMIQGNGVAIVPVGVISEDVRRLLWSFTTGLPTVTTQYLDPTNLNGQQAGLMIFNGTIWDNPGFEKKLRRIRFWYENYGVAVLTVTVSVWRPSISPDDFDVKTAVASFGTVAADLSERSGFFDIQAAGEIMVMQISRAAGGGQVSLLGFLPEFEDAGEKVEGQ
jgi:hypothetical protein